MKKIFLSLVLMMMIGSFALAAGSKRVHSKKRPTHSKRAASHSKKIAKKKKTKKHARKTVKKRTKKRTKKVASVKVPQRKWARQLKRDLSQDLCQKGEFFRECYRINQSKCMQTVKKATDECLEKVSLPSHISAFKQAKQIGLKVGSCVGTESQESLQTRKLTKVACADPQKW